MGDYLRINMASSRFANNGSSVVDYMLASSTLFNNVTNFGVHDYLFSLHCPLYCNFSFATKSVRIISSESTQRSTESPKHLYEKIIWNGSKKSEFDKKFNERIYPFYEDLKTFSATDMLENFIAMIKSCCPMSRKSIINGNNSSQPPWWNKECERAKHEKYRLLRLFRTTKDYSDLKRFQQARNIFKNNCKKSKLLYQNENRQNLKESCKDSKKF